MRQKRTAQASIYELFADHDLGRELEGMSAWLDAHRSLLTPVMNDLCRHGLKPTGRRGLSAESVVRCALLKQHRQLSYEELAFYLQDSASFQAFARLPGNERPSKSTLQRVISAVQASTKVLAQNESAVRFYETLGYARRVIVMSKRIGDAEGETEA